MSDTEISLCFWDYDRTRPLLDGRVEIPGFAPRYTVLPPEQAFAHAFGDAAFDVTEISFSNYMTALSYNRAAYRAIPVFLSRTFRHSSIFIRTDRGIEAPADLVGKTIGLQEYDMTAALVVRGVLRDEYGIVPSDIVWRVGDVEAVWRDTIPVPDVSTGVDVAAVPVGTTLDALLAAGELDGLLALAPPPSFLDAAIPVARLFPDWRTAEQAYFAKTGNFPIMHAMGIRSSLLDAEPGIAGAVFKAFAAAKAMAVAELAVVQAPKVTLPWVTAELTDTRSRMGEDFWPYGIAANRQPIELLSKWSYEEGLSTRRLAIKDLFSPACLDT